jgi:ribosomal protein S27AE
MSEGYLMIDHRASPGIPEALAWRGGLPAGGLREGAFLELKTKKCRHCGGVSVLNPERSRERYSCMKCGDYICDACKAATLASGYIHRSFSELADKVRSGRFTVSGDPSALILTPT